MSHSKFANGVVTVRANEPVTTTGVIPADKQISDNCNDNAKETEEMKQVSIPYSESTSIVADDSDNSSTTIELIACILPGRFEVPITVPGNKVSDLKNELLSKYLLSVSFVRFNRGKRDLEDTVVLVNKSIVYCTLNEPKDPSDRLPAHKAAQGNELFTKEQFNLIRSVVKEEGDLGVHFENDVAEFLTSKGVTVIQQKLEIEKGEIDIHAYFTPESLVNLSQFFVWNAPNARIGFTACIEVKLRLKTFFGKFDKFSNSSLDSNYLFNRKLGTDCKRILLLNGSRGTDEGIQELRNGKGSRKEKELWERLGNNVIVMKLNYVSMEWVNDVEADFKTMKSQLEDHSNQIMKMQSDHTSQMTAMQVEHSSQLSGILREISQMKQEHTSQMVGMQAQMDAMTKHKLF